MQPAASSAQAPQLGDFVTNPPKPNKNQKRRNEQKTAAAAAAANSNRPGTPIETDRSISSDTCSVTHVRRAEQERDKSQLNLGKLRAAAEKVVKIAGTSLENNPEGKAALGELKAALEGSATPQMVGRQKQTPPKPHVQKDTADLAEKLSETQKKLNAILPTNCPTDSDFQQQLASVRKQVNSLEEEVEDLEEKHDSLSGTVCFNITRLTKLVETYRKNRINDDEISVLVRAGKAEVSAKDERYDKDQVNQNRSQKLEELRLNWHLVEVRLENVKWHLSRLQMFVNLQASAKDLKEQLKCMDDQVLTPKLKNAQKALDSDLGKEVRQTSDPYGFASFKQELPNLENLFNQRKTKAEDLLNSVNVKIEQLDQEIKESRDHTKSKEAFKEYSVHKAVETALDEHYDKSVATLDDKVELRDDLSALSALLAMQLESTSRKFQQLQVTVHVIGDVKVFGSRAAQLHADLTTLKDEWRRALKQEENKNARESCKAKIQEYTDRYNNMSLEALRLESLVGSHVKELSEAGKRKPAALLEEQLKGLSVENPQIKERVRQVLDNGLKSNDFNIHNLQSSLEASWKTAKTKYDEELPRQLNRVWHGISNKTDLPREALYGLNSSIQEKVVSPFSEKSKKGQEKEKAESAAKPAQKTA